jgi:hypothetical protein
MEWAWIWFMFAILAFVLGYLLRDNIRSLWVSVRVNKKKNPDEKKPLPPKPSPSTDGGTCLFENEDVVLKQIYGYDGKRVQDNSGIPCSQCNQYIFRDEDGCVPYGYEVEKSGKGVCTIGEYVKGMKSCTKSTDCPYGSTCLDNVCTTWAIPESKMCPFK